MTNTLSAERPRMTPAVRRRMERDRRRVHAAFERWCAETGIEPNVEGRSLFGRMPAADVGALLDA